MNGGDNYDRPKVLDFKDLESRRIRTSMTSRSEVRKKLPNLYLIDYQFGYMLKNLVYLAILACVIFIPYV